MINEKQLVLEHYNCEELDELQVRARIGKTWYYITDLISKYRKEQKTKSKSKIRQEKMVKEFNLVRDSLVEETESYLIDLFRNDENIAVFLNRSSVNVFDPETQTTAYVLLSPSYHCVNICSKIIPLEQISKCIKKTSWSLSKTDEKSQSCLINKIKETKDVADCIFELINKLKYEL